MRIFVLFLILTNITKAVLSHFNYHRNDHDDCTRTLISTLSYS